ncbi:unnamed protein product, partial [Laminaria digitata]
SFFTADVCAEVVSALRPVCTGAGVEIDCEPRDMLTLVSLLESGGYRLPVAASSAGWSFDHVDCLATGIGTVGSSIGGTQSVGRWSGPLPMASGLVKRVVEKGDVFLVVENAIYVANVSWSGIISQEAMAHKKISSDVALETSVAIVRDGIG